MNYAVMWTAAAARASERLPDKVAAAAVESIDGSLNPQRFEFEGLHSARRGDQRVVYEIDQDRHPAPVGRVPATLRRQPEGWADRRTRRRGSHHLDHPGPQGSDSSSGGQPGT